MATPKGHFRSDGTCDCPLDGKCIDCGKPCNDHDLVADWYWCSDCCDKAQTKLGPPHNHECRLVETKEEK